MLCASRFMPSTPAATPDGRISHYQILYPLGAGGMGEVYAALDETLQRRVALKAIRIDRRLDEGARSRFLREARILSQLDHPNICRAFDYLRSGDHDWLVLELIDGQGLRDAVDSGIDRAAKLRIAEQIASVLVATHKAGVVHRDLKPGNVMLTRSGDVKVLDFGLARAETGRGVVQPDAAAAAALRSLAAADTELTRTISPAGDLTEASAFETRFDTISGTIAYMSPEQARGEAPTTASDMFSYGLLLQELFTGARAYPSGLDPSELVERVRAARTEPVRGADRKLAEFIQSLTALAPSERPTAVDALARLQWIRDTPKRRLRWTAATVVLLAVAAGAVKYTLDLRRERTIAVLARQDAERRRAQAEDLIGFMVGDLRHKLEKAGRLELLEDVGGKAMAYFASVPPGSLTGEELSRRAQTVYQIGAVRQARGDLKGAIESYRESLADAESLAAREPSNADWQLRLAYAHFYLADALRFENDLDGAMEHLAQYRAIAERLVARDSSNTTWQIELSYAQSNVAAIAEAKGDFAAARAGLERALTIRQRLVAQNPKDIQRQKDLAVLHNRLGVVLDRMGAGDLALQHYTADLQIREALVAGDQRDQSIKEDLYVALSYVSRAYEDRNDLQQALAYARRTFDVASALAAVDAANAVWRRDFASSESRMGNVLRWTGGLPEAASRFDDAARILATLVQKSPTNFGLRRDFAAAELGSGWVALARGALPSASSAATAVAGDLAPVVAKHADVDALGYAAEGRLLQAAVSARVPDRKRFVSESSAALALLETAIPDRRTIALRARALIALNRIDEARPLVEHLIATGYRHPALLADWRPHASTANR
jgi:eukaryotic-like serine/threonine-protein kinase